MSDLISNNTDAVQPDADDALWLAMRYVLGELSDEQAESFEAEMAEDIDLCEAVLQATLLNSAVALAYESQQSGSPASVGIASDESSLPVVSCLHVNGANRSSFARFGVFAATTAMVLAILAMVMLQNSPQVEALASDDATADMLAMLLDNSSSSDLSGEFDEFSSTDDSVSSLVAPEWLLTAVDLDSASGQEDIPVIRHAEESGVY